MPNRTQDDQRRDGITNRPRISEPEKNLDADKDQDTAADDLRVFGEAGAEGFSDLHTADADDKGHRTDDERTHQRGGETIMSNREQQY